ncbi:MAG: hypothetical protein IIY53_00435 [Solobacterium sp.]|nr:hypothetical protein [Solobacterium sp.]MBQ1320093.1 hypothetical protein [Solobacterium sp.]
MPDNIETMSDHELLMELVREQQRRDKREKTRLYISLAVLLVIVVILAVWVPKIIALQRELNDTLQQINAVAEQVENTLDGIDLEGLKNIMETLQKAIQKLSPFIH